MIGAIIGDTVGSVYEFNNIKTKEFPLFSSSSRLTDDSIMTLAIAECIQNGYINDKDKIIDTLKKWGRAYPNAGYGGMFFDWIFSGMRKSYNSYGNGAAMRISAVGWYADSEEKVKKMSKALTEVTHSHPEGIKGAEVTAMCVYYAKIGKSKEFIKSYVEKYYSLDFSYEELRKTYYHGEEICQNTVPQAIYCFLISNDFEDCLRTTISIGGDCDTTAAISCAIAEAYYKYIDQSLIDEVLKRIYPSNGCNPLYVINLFNNYKCFHSAFCEEISDSTIILGIESEYSNKKELEFMFSKSANALAEAFIYHQLDYIIGTEEDDVSKDYYFNRNIDDYFIALHYMHLEDTIYSELNYLCGICKSMLGITYLNEFAGCIKFFNDIFEKYNIKTKLILFKSINDALNYLNKEYAVNNEIYKEALMESYILKK